MFVSLVAGVEGFGRMGLGVGTGREVGDMVYVRNLNLRVERRRKDSLLVERGFESMRDRRKRT